MLDGEEPKRGRPDLTIASRQDDWEGSRIEDQERAGSSSKRRTRSTTVNLACELRLETVELTDRHRKLMRDSGLLARPPLPANAEEASLAGE